MLTSALLCLNNIMSQVKGDKFGGYNSLLSTSKLLMSSLTIPQGKRSVLTKLLAILNLILVRWSPQQFNVKFFLLIENPCEHLAFSISTHLCFSLVLAVSSQKQLVESITSAARSIIEQLTKLSQVCIIYNCWYNSILEQVDRNVSAVNNKWWMWLFTYLYYIIIYIYNI